MLSNLANLATIVGVLGVVLTFLSYRQGKKDTVNNNELANMPDFYFTAPRKCNRFGISFCDSDGHFAPECVTTCNYQKMIYWFNLINCGTFAAENVKIAVISQSELNTIPKDTARWQTIPYWSGMPKSGSSFESMNGDLVPIYTPIRSVQIGQDDQALYVLLEYTSSYSNIKYKRLYKWCISAEHIEYTSRNFPYFTEKDMQKTDFNQAKFKEFENEHTNTNEDGTRTVNLDEVLKNDFFSKNNMLTQEQTDFRNGLKEMRFTRPIFLEDVRLEKATSLKKPRFGLTKSKDKVSAEEWLNSY